MRNQGKKAIPINSASPLGINNTDIAANRNLGLDYLRAIALILMTSIHFARSIPGSSTSCLSFIGESAPAFFFFAFGLTMDKFLSKPFGNQLAVLQLFFYLAIAHNLFMYTPAFFVTEFFFFLLSWQVIFLAIEREKQATKDLYLFIFLILSVLMLIISNDLLSNIFSVLIPGPFPLLPWGLFVIAGLLYSRRMRNGFIWRGDYLISLCLILISWACYYLSKRIEWPGLEIIKEPLSAPYFLLFWGANILLLNLINSFNNLFSSIPIILKVVNFLSENLLLATVLHYIPVFLFKKLLLIFLSLITHDNYMFFYLLGSFLCNITLLLLVKAVLMVWSTMDNQPAINFLRRNYNSSSILIIALCSMGRLCFQSNLLTLLAMIYFALQLRSRKKALREVKL